MTLRKVTLDRLEIFQQHKTRSYHLQLNQLKNELQNKIKTISNEKTKFMDLLVKSSKAQTISQIREVNTRNLLHREMLNYSEGHKTNSNELTQLQCENVVLVEGYNKTRINYEQLQQMKVPYLIEEKCFKSESDSFQGQVPIGFYNSLRFDGHEEITGSEMTGSINVPVEIEQNNIQCAVTAHLTTAGDYTVKLSDSGTQLNVHINGDGLKEKRHASNSKKNITERLSKIRRSVIVKTDGIEGAI